MLLQLRLLRLRLRLQLRLSRLDKCSPARAAPPRALRPLRATWFHELRAAETALESCRPALGNTAAPCSAGFPRRCVVGAKHERPVAAVFHGCWRTGQRKPAETAYLHGDVWQRSAA